MTIRIETAHAVSITTDRPVSITSEGGETTMTIGAAESDRLWREAEKANAEYADAKRRLAPPRPPKPAEALLPSTTAIADRENRCGELMKRSGNTCARIAGHNGVHMSAEQLARKQSYNKDRARQRYAEDPEFREAVKAGSRASHARRKGIEPATE